MTTPASNEAAERLREAVERVLDWAPTAENAAGETMPADLRLGDLNEALAAEYERGRQDGFDQIDNHVGIIRRATVERIRDVLPTMLTVLPDYHGEGERFYRAEDLEFTLDAILDEEAAR